MLGIAGTVPVEGFPLTVGRVSLENGILWIENKPVPVNRGTPALLAAAFKTSEVLGQPPPFAYLAGDTGLGDGSRRIYEYLAAHLADVALTTIVFHYLQPDVDWHCKVLFAMDSLKSKPILIADAGFMYAAKMSGQAGRYDLFTPDIGELAFLADEKAPHPFYTRSFIIHEENRISELIKRAYRYNNASRYLLVKGSRDYLASRSGVLATIEGPSHEAMEAIGGTGDTLTGIVAALIDGGIEIERACIVAAKTNRMMGNYTALTPATQVAELIDHIEGALLAAMECESL